MTSPRLNFLVADLVLNSPHQGVLGVTITLRPPSFPDDIQGMGVHLVRLRLHHKLRPINSFMISLEPP